MSKNNGNFESFSDFIHPDDIPGFEKLMLEAVQKRESVQTEFRVITSYGVVCWVHFGCQYFYDDKGNPIQVIGVVKDITQQKRIETSLAESEQRFRSILENAPDGVFVNTQGVFSYVNPKMIAILKVRLG